MQTHVKEALATVVSFLAITSVVHAGIWFHLFGIPEVRVLGFPFHYFWFVAGAPVAMFVTYGVYYLYVTTSIAEEKAAMTAEGIPSSTEEREVVDD